MRGSNDHRRGHPPSSRPAEGQLYCFTSSSRTLEFPGACSVCPAAWYLQVGRDKVRLSPRRLRKRVHVHSKPKNWLAPARLSEDLVAAEVARVQAGLAMCDQSFVTAF